jgi:hypothetical protein
MGVAFGYFCFVFEVMLFELKRQEITGGWRRLHNERIVLLDFIHHLVSQKLRNKKYIPNITIHTSTKFTQGSITNHRATYLGAYTHKPLKQVRHQWQ